MRITLITAALLAMFAAPVRAGVPGVGAGDLIKIRGEKAVYYLDRDWKRHPFPNLNVFHSWYHDFLQVKEISAAEMTEFSLGAPVTYRPGTRLVKIASVPRTYAVEPGGTLRWIESEEVAVALYGKDWAKRVDDVPDAFFGLYREGAPLTLPAWPTGTLLKRDADGARFVIDGGMKRAVAADDATALRLLTRNEVLVAGDLAEYPDGLPLTAPDPKLTDTAEQSIVESVTPPVVDFPKLTQGMTPGQDSPLAQFRVTTGMPTALRKVTVILTGLPYSGETPLTDVHVTDAEGNDLFGIQQAPVNGTGELMLTFSGAASLSAGRSHVIQVRAKVPVTLPSGTKFGAAFPRTGMEFADDGNGNAVTRFWYPTSLVSKAK